MVLASWPAYPAERLDVLVLAHSGATSQVSCCRRVVTPKRLLLQSVADVSRVLLPTIALCYAQLAACQRLRSRKTKRSAGLSAARAFTGPKFSSLFSNTSAGRKRLAALTK